MNNTIIIILIVIASWFIVSKVLDKKLENFMWDPLWAGNDATDCYGLSSGDCLKYSNCGLCLKNKKSKCVPGDQQGPYFKTGCKKWAYGNYYDKQLFDEADINVTPSFDHRYPDYEIWYPSPISRSALR